MKNLTRIEAGMDLDAEIAEKLFGWYWRDLENGESMLLPPEGDERINWTTAWNANGYPAYLPRYSERLGEAWEIIDRLMEEDILVSIHPRKEGFRIQTEQGNLSFVVYDNSLPLSICRAAIAYLIGEEA